MAKVTLAALVCPECKSEDVGEADTLLATAHGSWFRENGKPTFDPSGDTKVHWDSQEAIKGEECYYTNCDWSGTPEELVPAEPDPTPTELFYDLSDVISDHFHGQTPETIGDALGAVENAIKEAS